jgi:hypothetical protein
LVLALVTPLLADWAKLPTSLEPAFYGPWGWLCAVAAAGVVVSGLRDPAPRGRAARIAPAPAAPLAAGLGGRRAVLVTGATGFIGRRRWRR